MSQVDFFPTRSAEGKAALDVFFVKFNDVNFYVEDEEQENLYFEILKKKFPEIRFDKIFPLGGKRNVIGHAEDEENRNLSAKLVYIVDKDFDDLLCKKLDDERIFYLDRYCIENYFVDAVAVAKLVIETYPKQKFEDVYESLGISVWGVKILKDFLPLFANFYCVQSLNLSLKNCDSKPEEYTVAKMVWQVDKGKIEDYYELSHLISQMLDKEKKFLDLYEKVLSETEAEEDFHALISGKFIMAMLFHYVKSVYKLGSISFDSFIFRVVKNSELSDLAPVFNKISAYLAK